MFRNSRRDEEEVKVHMTFLGGMYVNLGELLCSKAARKTMAEVARAFGDEDTTRRIEEEDGLDRPVPQHEQ